MEARSFSWDGTWDQVKASSFGGLLLTLLYTSAGRVSEVCSLTWADAKPNGNSGQIILFGKGDKTRAVKLSKATW